MGVDYDATFGVGVIVNEPDFESEEMIEKGYEYTCEWLDCILTDTEFNYGESGYGAYTGNDNTFYIFISNPFAEGLDALQVKMDNLYKFLKENKIDYEGEINLVGGVHCW